MAGGGTGASERKHHSACPPPPRTTHPLTLHVRPPRHPVRVVPEAHAVAHNAVLAKPAGVDKVNGGQPDVVAGAQGGGAGGGVETNSKCGGQALSQLRAAHGDARRRAPPLSPRPASPIAACTSISTHQAAPGVHAYSVVQGKSQPSGEVAAAAVEASIAGRARGSAHVSMIHSTTSNSYSASSMSVGVCIRGGEGVGGHVQALHRRVVRCTGRPDPAPPPQNCHCDSTGTH